MLSERDFRRIVKELDSVKNMDVVEFLEKRSPWFRFLEPAIQRAVKVLEELNIFHVLYGLRPLPLYGVPYISRDITFAVRLKDQLDDVLERFSVYGFRRIPGPHNQLSLLDLQSNRRIDLLFAPKPLEWDEELIERCLKRRGLRILSAEDYALALIAVKADMMRLELAAKVLYANSDKLDLEYLETRASRLSLRELPKKLLENLRK